MSAVSLMSQAEYAKHRGVSAVAVHKAIKAKRISLIGDKIDPVVADIQWERNTRARVQHKPAPAAEQASLVDAPAGGAAAQATAGAPADPPAVATAAGDSDYQRARTRREEADAQLAEIKLKEQLGVLVNADAARAEYAKHVAAVRDAALQISGRLAPVLAAEIDVAKIQALLDVELRQVLKLFASEASA